MRNAFGVILLLAGGCEAGIGGGANTSADAPAGSPDAAISTIDASSTDAPACANGRAVFLNFEGVELSDAMASDATQDDASWMTIATGTAPRYRIDDPNRDAAIQAIVTGIRAQLAPFPMSVVTTRPATGPYVMIVFGGTAAQVGSRYSLAVNELDCTDVTKSDVAWVADTVTGQRAVNFAIGAIGFGLGLTATTDPMGCMCGWDNDCASDNSVACKLSSNIARDPAARQLCAGVTTQNEIDTFDQAFCE